MPDHNKENELVDLFQLPEWQDYDENSSALARLIFHSQPVDHFRCDLFRTWLRLALIETSARANEVLHRKVAELEAEVARLKALPAPGDEDELPVLTDWDEMPSVGMEFPNCLEEPNEAKNGVAELWLPEGWTASHPKPWSGLTEEAQVEHRYSVERTDPPFMAEKSKARVWSGPTLDAALRAAHTDLGMPYFPPVAPSEKRDLLEQDHALMLKTLEYSILHSQIAGDTLVEGYKEMAGMRCGYTDTASTHIDIVTRRLKETLQSLVGRQES